MSFRGDGEDSTCRCKASCATPTRPEPSGLLLPEEPRGLSHPKLGMQLQGQSDGWGGSGAAGTRVALVPPTTPRHRAGHRGCFSSAAFSRRGFLKGKSLLVQGVCLTHINSQL